MDSAAGGGSGASAALAPAVSAATGCDWGSGPDALTALAATGRGGANALVAPMVMAKTGSGEASAAGVVCLRH